jgi:hypothetical protein
MARDMLWSGTLGGAVDRSAWRLPSPRLSRISSLAGLEQLAGAAIDVRDVMHRARRGHRDRDHRGQLALVRARRPARAFPSDAYSLEAHLATGCRRCPAPQPGSAVQDNDPDRCIDRTVRHGVRPKGIGVAVHPSSSCGRRSTRCAPPGTWCAPPIDRTAGSCSTRGTSAVAPPIPSSLP